MKKLVFLALALLSLVGFAHTGHAASCFGDTDKFSTAQWCINSQDTLIPTTSAGQQVITESFSSTSNNLLLVDESGKTIVDMGGKTAPTQLGGCMKHVLPRASAGLTFTIVTGVRCVVTVDTIDTDDTILWSTGGFGLDAGDSLKTTGDAGDFITVTSPAANKWAVTNFRGVLLDNGTN